MKNYLLGFIHGSSLAVGWSVAITTGNIGVYFISSVSSFITLIWWIWLLFEMND